VKQGRAKVDGVATAILDRAGSKLADQARAADLLGAIVNDLKPFDYQPPDPVRYQALMDATLGVFERGSVKRVEFAVRLAAAEALGQAGDPRLSRENWIRIEGGKSGLKSFEIGKYPVTVREYARFMEAGGYREKQWWSAGGFGRENQPGGWDGQTEHPNWPVTRVNSYEASAYAAWSGGRLLTEAEWELAARGERGREYPWGNEKPDATRANYKESGPQQATPVGLYPFGATPEGVEDMAGNVWEWMASWYDQAQTMKVLQGGSWSGSASGLHASGRNRGVPGLRNDNLGFRVAREVPVP
jgi:formylglycine-generating enzyme required for sulfatase activity